MENDEVIQQKTFAFAIRMVNVYKQLVAEKKEFILTRQLVRSGTSIGANIEAALSGKSENYFIYRLGISYKEARETVYWLKLLKATGFLTEQEAGSLLPEAEEICRLAGKIQISQKKRNSGE
jgi:four helix bundle protein